MSDAFHVVLAEPFMKTEAEMTPVIDVLEQSLGILRLDGMRMVRDGQGVLLENVSGRDAQTVVDALRAVGIVAGSVDAQSVGDWGAARKVREVIVEKSALQVQTGYMGFDQIPWSRVQLLSVCLYQETQTKMAPKKEKSRRGGGMFAIMGGGAIGAGLAVGRGLARAHAARGKAREARAFDTKKLQTTSYIADIYCTDPQEIYRIQSNTTHYSYLRSRIQQSSQANFLTVLFDIVEMGETVLPSPLAQRFLDGDDLADLIIDNLHEFDRYNRWLFLAAAAFADAESQEDDTPPRQPGGGTLPAEGTLRHKGFEF